MNLTAMLILSGLIQAVWMIYHNTKSVIGGKKTFPRLQFLVLERIKMFMKFQRSRLPLKNLRSSSSSLKPSVMRPLMLTPFLLMLSRDFETLLPLCLISTTTKLFEQPLSYLLHLKLPPRKSSTNHAMFSMTPCSDNLATTLKLFRHSMWSRNVSKKSLVSTRLCTTCALTLAWHILVLSRNLAAALNVLLRATTPEVLATSGGIRKVPQRRFVTLPIGPQLQALWRTPEGARNM